MAKSSELLWLDAIEAIEEGDREAALSLANKVISLDEKHSDAWMAVAQLTLPADSRGKPAMPDLAQASKSMSALRKVVTIDPENQHAWRLGGEIMVGHLGMLEHGLQWWEDRKEVAPSDVVPYFEQISILIRLGYFEEAGSCLESLDEIVAKQPNKSLETRAHRMREIFMEQSSMESEVSFSPQNSKDESWGLIKRMMGKKPISETYFLLMFVMPIVFLLGSGAMMLFEGVKYGTAMVMLLIIAMYFWIARLSRRLLLKLNRPESFLNRAIDLEASTGKVCIPEDIRSSKLYSHTIDKRLPAYQERLENIERADEALQRSWELVTPF